MPSEGIDVGHLLDNIKRLEEDCKDYQNKIKVLSDLFGDLSQNTNILNKQYRVCCERNDRYFDFLIALQDFYKENDRMSKKQFSEILKKYRF